MNGLPAKRWIWLAGAASLALAGASQATPVGGSAAPLVPRPDRPLAAPEAPTVETEGRVVLRCTVVSGGTVDDCSVAQETPPGHGLGEAAMHMYRQMKIRPETFRPGMVGATVDIPLRFAPDSAAEEASMP